MKKIGNLYQLGTPNTITTKHSTKRCVHIYRLCLICCGHLMDKWYLSLCHLHVKYIINRIHITKTPYWLRSKHLEDITAPTISWSSMHTTKYWKSCEKTPYPRQDHCSNRHISNTLIILIKALLLSHQTPNFWRTPYHVVRIHLSYFGVMPGPVAGREFAHKITPSGNNDTAKIS